MKPTKKKQIHIRVTDSEKEEIEKNATKMGFKQVSEYLRFLGMCKPIFELEISDHIGVKQVIKAKVNLEKPQ